MKIALAQLNYTIGDIAGNTAKIIIAVERAKEAGAGKLVLGHYSSRYKSLDTMLEEAKEIFPNTELAKEGMKFEIELDKFKE